MKIMTNACWLALTLEERTDIQNERAEFGDRIADELLQEIVIGRLRAESAQERQSPTNVVTFAKKPSPTGQ